MITMNEKKHSSPGRTVVLTGSTGNFGSYILDGLINDPRYTRIVCLNRSKQAQERQLESLKERDLTTNLDVFRVHFHTADLSQEDLGLSQGLYEDLARNADLFIHNAWPVNFNHHFRTFEQSLKGVKNITRFCMANQNRQTQLIFISSMSAVSNFGAAAPSSLSKVPEAEIRDWKVAKTGYGQSKLVSERLLAHTSREEGLPATIIRVGQLGGPTEHGVCGAWNQKEWLPSLVRSSAFLRALPSDLGPTSDTDWVPVDVASRVLLEICGGLFESQQSTTGRDEARFFHLVNPKIKKWSELAPRVQEHLQTKNSKVRLVGFVEWVDLLRLSAKTSKGNEPLNPAVKLLEFFDTMRDRAIRFPKTKSARLDTKETVKVSPTLAKLESVTPEWMELWMQQWDRIQ